MNVVQILQESYKSPEDRKDANDDATEKASADSKRASIWQQWCEIPVTQEFLKNTMLQRDTLIDDVFRGVIKGDITDVVMRAKMTEAATLNKVVETVTSNQGNY